MPPEPATKPGPAAAGTPDPNAPPVVAGPPDEELWEKYNKHLEFPTGVVTAILLHVAIAALLVVIFKYLIKPEARDLPPIVLKEVGGLDDFGAGSAGSGGEPEPERTTDPTKEVLNQIDPKDLPKIREKAAEALKQIDPNMPVTEANKLAIGQLDEAIRNKFARQGSGKEKGKGFDGSKGTGPGGTGSDATFARSMRWSLWFNVTGGNDYVGQLRAMGAKILVWIPPENKRYIFIPDLGNPSVQKSAGAEDIDAIADLMQFSEARRGEVREVAQALKLDFNPTVFTAVFSKELEAELARKEIAYNNLRPDDIAKTSFEVKVIGNEVRITVREQVRKR